MNVPVKTYRQEVAYDRNRTQESWHYAFDINPKYPKARSGFVRHTGGGYATQDHALNAAKALIRRLVKNSELQAEARLDLVEIP